jgi:hypothetical protein
MRIPTNVLSFAMGEANLAPYKMFYDYWNQYRSQNGAKNVEFQTNKEDGTPITFAEKEEKMTAALRKEILRVSGIKDFGDFPTEQWVTHPMLNWATFAVVSALVDMILPETIIDTIGLYTDVRTIGWGDSAAFDVEPRDLFVVSKSGKAQRTSEIHKQFRGQVTIIPVMHELSVQVSLYKVLSGAESLANFVAKVVRSVETQVTLDAYNAFATAMAALSNTATTGLRVSGYTQAYLLRLCQQVTAWNGGAKAVVAGTPLALINILPDDANYRYILESDYVKIGYIRTAFGYDVMSLPQVADYTTPWAMALDDTKLWIVSPSSQKILKLVLEGSTLSNTTQPYQNANLTQNSTLYKSWNVGVATNSVGGIITLP